MDKQNESTKKSSSIYTYSLITDRPTGTTGYLAQNSPITTKYIRRQAFRPSLSTTDDIPKREQTFLKKSKANQPPNSHKPWNPFGKKPPPLYELLPNK